MQKSHQYLDHTLACLRFALDVNVTDSSGATPLMLAALTGNLEIIERLVQKGARLNTQDSANGWTALMQVGFCVFLLTLGQYYQLLTFCHDLRNPIVS